MATQTGITIDGPNKPEPLQQHSGLLINEWPAIIGSDCAAVVIAVGPDCQKLSPGDYVYGCAPLGQNRFTPFQETFLVEEKVFLKKSPNLSIEETCTIGVGILTAGLCLLGGAELELSEDGTKAPAKDEWIVVLGGTGSVGQFAIAHVCGYKVLASCSPSKESIAQVAKENGAIATFNSRGSVEEQLADIKKITGGNFARIVDSTAYGYEIMVKALETCSTATTKYLMSVDDWSEFKTPPTIKEYRAELGHLCRLDEALGIEVTKDIARWIPTFETHLATGTIKPTQYQVADGMGWETVIQGIQDLEDGKALKKIVARVQKE
ncbi:hypothetical protein G7Z17_g2678 [Cylindrodendrum hubeiense]|uniref:Enoyl reductase (ER) domain-containing protein n=1 Tax=Cylindrodendrum hubeiense TaxID=595255 RepID=A0A9P5HKD1_9HYPO|nr:hypothetical protein G7Z17_g2678 [Cylindrodendrum hubeiense]